ncbi:hypothetical protein RFI_12128, partial [Reticulomyxa filosa]
MPDGSKSKVAKSKDRVKKMSFRKQELTPLTALIKIDPTLPTIDSKVENTPVLPTSTNLAKALERSPGMSVSANDTTNRNGFGSVALDTIKTKALTFRMMSDRPEQQIRLKLYLPHERNDPTPQAMIVFINNGTSMQVMIEFLESAYPQNYCERAFALLSSSYLKGRIKQLCIADEDGDIDEDFPPMNPSQDISAMGVGHFYVDCRFDNDSDNGDNEENDGNAPQRVKMNQDLSISNEVLSISLPFSKEEHNATGFTKISGSQLTEQLKQQSSSTPINHPLSGIAQKDDQKKRASASSQNSSKLNIIASGQTEKGQYIDIPQKISLSLLQEESNDQALSKKKQQKTGKKSIFARFCCCNGRDDMERLNDTEEDEEQELGVTQTQVGYHPPYYNNTANNVPATRAATASQ